MARWSTWNDWVTKSLFRVRISLGAAETLRRLPETDQQKLKEMLEDVAELAASAPAGLAHAWKTSFNRPLLQLRAGRVMVRYAIDEDTRTISVEHALIAEDAAAPEAGPPLGKTA